MEGLPLGEQIKISRHFRAALGDLLSTTPMDGADLAAEIRSMAQLAAAFRVKLAGDAD